MQLADVMADNEMAFLNIRHVYMQRTIISWLSFGSASVEIT